MIKRYLIIGASAAGIGCALRLRMLDATAQITLLNAESGLPYNKCHLADVLLQEKNISEITFCSKDVLAQKNIELVSNAPVISIDPEQKLVTTSDGRTCAYDALCIATGKSPRMLPIFENKNFANLFNFYYKSDLEKIISHVNSHGSRNAVIIGAGLTGLEAADGLRARGLQVTLVEAAPQLLPSFINEPASQVIVQKALEFGVTVLTGNMVIAYEQHEHKITALQLSNHVLTADVVVCAIGATPNTSFLSEQLQLSHGYCMVDEHMQTSIPGIYAAGDCCHVYDQLTKQVQPNALWPDAMQQGMYAAYGMVGIPKKYPGSVSIASSSFFGLKVAIAGSLNVSPDQRVEELTGESAYHRLVYEADKLVGFMLIGNTQQLSEYRRQLLSQ
jgi:nitrite reductase (NADH) large subunit